MPKAVKRCVRCRADCTNDNMSLTIKMTDGPTVLRYKPLYVCSELCLTFWADNMIWHADDDPRVEAAGKRLRLILDALEIEGGGSDS